MSAGAGSATPIGVGAAAVGKRTDHLRRAAMIAHSFYPGDVRIRREAVALREAGWEVDVLCLRGPGETARGRVDGVNVYRVPLGRARGSRVRYAAEYGLAFFALAGALTARMLRKRYSVVQVHTLPDFLVFAAAPAKWLGARVLLDMHEIAPEFYQQKYGASPSRLMVRLLAAVEQASLRFADGVLTVSDALRDRFVTRGAAADRIALVMNSADECLFPPASGVYVRGEGAADPFQLVYHGSLLPYYGIDVLIEALAKLGARVPFTLDLYGGGEAAEPLRAVARDRGVADRVHFCGTVAHAAVAGILQRAGAGVVPTRGGPMLDLSLSNKLLEMACVGMPIVASALPSYRRYLPDDAVLYVPPADANALAAALERLAGMSASVRSALARRAADAYRRWNWGRQREVYVGVVERLRTAGRASAPDPMEV